MFLPPADCGLGVRVQYLLVDLLRARAGWDLLDLWESFGAGELWTEAGGGAAEEEEEKEGGDGGEWNGDAGECRRDACACVGVKDCWCICNLARSLVGSYQAVFPPLPYSHVCIALDSN